MMEERKLWLLEAIRCELRALTVATMLTVADKESVERLKTALEGWHKRSTEQSTAAYSGEANSS